MKIRKAAKYFPALLILLITPSLLIAQSEREITTEDLRNLTEGRNVPQHRAVVTEGSPYLQETFLDGTVVLLNGRRSENLSIKFNIHENRIEFKSDDSIFIIEGYNIREFTIHDSDGAHTFKKGYSARGLDVTDFVRVLSEGKATILLRHEVGFQPNVATYGTATQKDVYLTNETLYILKDGETERIRNLRERNILRSFDSDRKEIQNYTQENNLDLSTLKDIRKLFDYYNSLH
jgi:hypothetical protein